MPEMGENLLSEMLQWYRMQRHDYMNHWQVIMGYLQLGRSERALDYMKETNVNSLEEQKVSQIPQPFLAAICLGFLIRLSHEGIIVSLDFPNEMKRADYWKNHWREEYAEGLYGYTREWMEIVLQHKESKELSVEVYLFDEPEGWSCQFLLSDERSVLRDNVVMFNS